MAELYVQYQRTPYYDRQSGMTYEVGRKFIFISEFANGCISKTDCITWNETVVFLLKEYHEAIERSKCLYVGNLSYFTTEAQLYEFFSRCGEVCNFDFL